MISKGLKVHKSDAERTIKDLLSLKVLDKSLKITKVDQSIIIPVLEYPLKGMGTKVLFDFKRKKAFRNPYEEVLEQLSGKNIDPEVVPDKWVKYGDSLILRVNSDKKTAKIIGNAYRKVFEAKSVYRLKGIIEGEYRTPSLELLSGDGGETLHVENGIKYVFDPEKIMFSPGNVNERTGMKSESLTGKVVLDMFCGIGYFSLPIAMYGDPEKIYACDINPDAIRYLRQNSRLNRVEGKIIPILGDSRDVNLPEKVDYVVLGNFRSIQYLPNAISRVKPGGTLVLHHLVSTEKIISSNQRIMKMALRLGSKIDILDSHIVKSYGPNQWHLSTKISVF